MYFSFQHDSVTYDSIKAKCWANFLNREWNVREIAGVQVDPDTYFLSKYNITLDREKGIIIGINVPDEMYTLLLLQEEIWL